MGSPACRCISSDGVYSIRLIAGLSAYRLICCSASRNQVCERSAKSDASLANAVADFQVPLDISDIQTSPRNWGNKVGQNAPNSVWFEAEVDAMHHEQVFYLAG